MLITGKPFQFCTWNIARNFCSGWGGAACRTECMLHLVVIIENVMTFATAVPISSTSFVYSTNVYWSVIHGIKRKPHLSVVWNGRGWCKIAIATKWYQFHTTDAWWFSLSRTWSTLVQAMAWCLMAPSHYMNWCWLIISEVFWHSPKGNFMRSAGDVYPWFEFENC